MRPVTSSKGSNEGGSVKKDERRDFALREEAGDETSVTAWRVYRRKLAKTRTPRTRAENFVLRTVLRAETRCGAFSTFVIRAHGKVAAARLVEFLGFAENPISTNFTGGRDSRVWQPFRLARLPATRYFPEVLMPSERGENV